MRQYANRRDRNEPEIIEALLAVGATVEQISKEDVWDLMVGFRGQTFNLEVKFGREPLRPGQFAWGENWQGHKAVVRSVEDALAAIGAVK